MEPRIQYAKTADGVSIAYWTLGEGTPLVHLPHAYSHIELEWGFQECRRWYERLAEKRKLVRWDYRGSGLSERNVTDFSLDATVLDLEAVVDRLGLESFALFAPMHGGPVAIAYAVRHPERVSHLILWCAYAHPREWTRSPQSQALRASMEKDWAFYTESVARMFMGWEAAGDAAHRFVALIRESITEEMVQRAVAAVNQFDVSSLLSQVRSPTLILHRRQCAIPDIDAARHLAAEIPDSRLVILDGEPLVPYLGDTEAVLAAIDEFLGEGEKAAAPDTKSDVPSGTAIILFADIVDSTGLTERLGDTAFRDKARNLDGVLRTAIRECEGAPVEGKLVGDGVLAVFTSARQAIEAALRCGAAGEFAGLPLHLGIHAGDVIREGNNVYGGAVNIASRISGLSAPGEVLVSDTVRGLARTSAGVRFEDQGEHELKGIAEPQRLFAVRAQSAGS